MLVSLEWVREFVSLPPLPSHHMMKRFTVSTCEVEAIHREGAYLDQVEIVEIISVRPHPNAQTLTLVRFRWGDKEREVVCGAPGLESGMKAVYAPPGTKLPGKDPLEGRQIRGILSEGMLCSAKELGQGEDEEGCFLLPKETPGGISLGDFLGEMGDAILEIDNKSLTHRPDLWGIYGMAREFATLYKKELATPFTSAWEQSLTESVRRGGRTPVSLHVEDDSANLGFWGCSLRNVRVEPSPAWMIRRLEASGQKSINNIIDISNYVMLELGIPLHIFDKKKIKGRRVIVKRLGREAHFTTLDGVERTLMATDTVVCDTEGPMSIAGIIGGLHSGVDEGTTEIFLETGNWQAKEIRKISTRLGLRTEASQRYEKGLDTTLLKRSFLRAVELLLSFCPEAEIEGEYLREDKEPLQPLPSICTTAKRISAVLGHPVSCERITEILESLGFTIALEGDEMILTVPSFRATGDIQQEIDIVEEVGRIIGYDTITPSPPLGIIRATPSGRGRRCLRDIQDFLVLSGRAHEIMTYPLVGEAIEKRVCWPQHHEALRLVNALSPEMERMRPSLIPSLIEAVQRNQKNYPSFRLFEIGRGYLSDPHLFATERDQVVVGFFDREQSRFMALANLFEDLFAYVRLPLTLVQDKRTTPQEALSLEWPGFHPEQWFAIRGEGGGHYGFLTSLHPYVAQRLRMRGELALALLDVTDLKETARKRSTKVHVIPRFPPSLFDCTVVTQERTPVADILASLSSLGIKEIDSIRIVGVFMLPGSRKSVTLRFFFRDKERTLPGEFLKGATEKIIATLREAGYPLKE